MSCSGSNLGGEDSKEMGVVNRYLNSVVAPLKTLTFKEGVLLMEEVKAPKTEGTMEERLQVLEDTVFRYGTVIERSLDAHHLRNIEMEKKIEAYEARSKDMEEKIFHILTQLDRFQALMWDVENQNCEYEDRFNKITEAASTKFNDPPTSFYNGRPYPWKLKEWDTHYEEESAKKDDTTSTN